MINDVQYTHVYHFTDCCSISEIFFKAIFAAFSFLGCFYIEIFYFPLWLLHTHTHFISVCHFRQVILYTAIIPYLLNYSRNFYLDREH
jgi:hypothetical protein